MSMLYKSLAELYEHNENASRRDTQHTLHAACFSCISPYCSVSETVFGMRWQFDMTEFYEDVTTPFPFTYSIRKYVVSYRFCVIAIVMMHDYYWKIDQSAEDLFAVSKEQDVVTNWYSTRYNSEVMLRTSDISIIFPPPPAGAISIRIHSQRTPAIAQRVSPTPDAVIMHTCAHTWNVIILASIFCIVSDYWARRDAGRRMPTVV